MNKKMKNAPSKAIRAYVREEVIEALAFFDYDMFSNEEWIQSYYYRDSEGTGLSMDELKRAEAYAYDVYDKSAEKFENAEDVPDYDDAVAIVDEVMKNA